jgi:hypothetical protein
MYSIAIAFRDLGQNDRARDLLVRITKVDPTFAPAGARLAEWDRVDNMPAPSTPGAIVGQVSNLQHRSDPDSLVTRGQMMNWTFRIERANGSGGALPPVPVTMRAPRIEGAVVNGDVVEVPGPWRPGETLRPKKIKNVTTNTFVVAKHGQRRLMIGVIALFVLGLIAFGWWAYQRVDDDTSVPIPTRSTTTPQPDSGPTEATLSAVSLDPETVTGGTPSSGTATLNAEAPADGVNVSLSSSNTDAATVPSTVTVPVGSTSTTFDVTTIPSSEDASSTISATAGGVTESAALTVSAASGADKVAVTRAQYSTEGKQLGVDATSSSADAILTVFEARTGEQIGVLESKGEGAFAGAFDLPSAPQEITVKSNLGGTATVPVEAG